MAHRPFPQCIVLKVEKAQTFGENTVAVQVFAKPYGHRNSSEIKTSVALFASLNCFHRLRLCLSSEKTNISQDGIAMQQKEDAINLETYLTVREYSFFRVSLLRTRKLPSGSDRSRFSAPNRVRLGWNHLEERETPIRSYPWVSIYGCFQKSRNAITRTISSSKVSFWSVILNTWNC